MKLQLFKIVKTNTVAVQTELGLREVNRGSSAALAYHPFTAESLNNGCHGCATCSLIY